MPLSWVIHKIGNIHFEAFFMLDEFKCAKHVKYFFTIILNNVPSVFFMQSSFYSVLYSFYQLILVFLKLFC